MIQLESLMNAIQKFTPEHGYVYMNPKDLEGLEKAHSLPGTKAESVFGFPIKTSALIERGNFYITERPLLDQEEPIHIIDFKNGIQDIIKNQDNDGRRD